MELLDEAATVDWSLDHGGHKITDEKVSEKVVVPEEDKKRPLLLDDAAAAAKKSPTKKKKKPKRPPALKKTQSAPLPVLESEIPRSSSFDALCTIAVDLDNLRKLETSRKRAISSTSLYNFDDDCAADFLSYDGDGPLFLIEDENAEDDIGHITAAPFKTPLL